jgi:excisionase family DNA binding protein
MGVSECARHFRVHVQSIYKLIWAGKIRAERVDGHWRIEVASVRPWYSDDPEMGGRRRMGETAEANAG